MRLQLCDGIKSAWEHQRAVLLFAAALLFLHRPLMAAGSFSWAGITIFTEGLYVLLALGMLFFRWNEVRELLLKTSPGIKIPLLILLLSGILHWTAGGFYHPEFLGLALAWSILPLFGAVYQKDLEKVLPSLFSVFWILNVLVCIYTESFSTGMFGLTGNWNWSAALLLGTAPFAIDSLPKTMRFRKSAAIGICFVTAVLLFFLQSRAVLISAVFAAGVFCFLKFRKLRMPMILAGILILFAGIYLSVCVFPEKTSSFLSGEIRVELWKGTVDLLRDSPLGVGAATFENSFIPYRSVRYFLNDHAAIRTTHPHNEFLYLAAALGIPAMLAFLFWCAVLVRNVLKEYDSGTMSRERLMFLMMLCIFVLQGMLDLTFHVWPLGIFLFLLIGMFLFPEVSPDDPAPADSPARRIGLIVTGLAVILAAVNLVGTFSWVRSHHAVIQKDPITAKHYAKTGMYLGNIFPNQIYHCAIDFSRIDKEFALRLTDLLQQTPWKDFAHIHALKAQIYVLQGKDAEAAPEYLMDAQCYPIQILPYIGAWMAYGRMGKIDLANGMKEMAANMITLRNLSPSDVQAIMKKPEYDLSPKEIGKQPPSYHIRWGFYKGKRSDR